MTRSNQGNTHSKVNKLLSSMDKDIADSFTFEQRKALKKCLNVRDWRKHSIDLRPTLALPLFPWSFYIVFLAGANKRELTYAERFIALFSFLSVIFFFGLFLIACTLLLLYLLKSWLGIDLFPNESLGIWDQFKSYF